MEYSTVLLLKLRLRSMTNFTCCHDSHFFDTVLHFSPPSLPNSLRSQNNITI
ncbi:hypothetical protein JHK85_003436 [Glycine max]|uniref:Uncharacterized protein n=1 Tax=Glycine max TaxID=3847 RepID=A0A0R0KXV4_SOYBN|nr:hypothetical protein JHK87_003116 [Glycine soja]KAG5062253.1 hypothetical protein JHK85_003436 [Glycine max]KAG5079204.1 hypothetical protein JHK86_003269 [Glycine max]